ncbi:MAG TPA: hypothetical protein DIW31_05705 [Bacteroidales bacterium]|nr:hypothetical protein [Bacteroidales bacterium]
MISKILDGLLGVLNYLLQTLAANWFILLFGILIAVAISVYVDAEKTRKLFLRRPRFLVLGSVAFGAFTPLCACGTMAVVLSLVSSTIPWGAIMAFLVSSPLMSPDTFVIFSGFMGLKFAAALAASSIIIGLGAGWITHLIERKTKYLDNQLRLNGDSVKKTNESILSSKAESNAANLKAVTLMVDEKSASSCCSKSYATQCCREQSVSLGFTESSSLENLSKFIEKIKLKKVMLSFIELGIIKVFPLFMLFVVIAYIVKEYVPTEWVVTLFNGKHFYSVPLATLVGLPMYVSDATVVPLLQVLRDAGASDGAILAYMISGPATSIGVIGGLTVIMKRRAIILYLTIILIGSVLLGYGYDLFLALI